jgi:hypothetical protein
VGYPRQLHSRNRWKLSTVVIEKFRIMGDARSERPCSPEALVVHVSVAIIGHLDELDSIDTIRERPQDRRKFTSLGPAEPRLGATRRSTAYK